MLIHQDTLDDPIHVETNISVIQKSTHIIWIRNARPYVFCQDYVAELQSDGESDVFQIYFKNEEGKCSFCTLHASRSELSC